MNEIAKGIVQADFFETGITVGIVVLLVIIFIIIDFVTDVWGKKKR